MTLTICYEAYYPKASNGHGKEKFELFFSFSFLLFPPFFFFFFFVTFADWIGLGTVLAIFLDELDIMSR